MAAALVQSVVAQMRGSLPFLSGAPGGGGAGRTASARDAGGPVAARRVATAQRYMQLRLAGRVDELMGLVSDDVVLRSSRDGEYAGRRRFEEYVRRVRPVGTWGAAAWNRERGRAEIRGLVKILVVSVGVTANFGFDRRGKINEIYVGTGNPP